MTEAADANELKRVENEWKRQRDENFAGSFFFFYFIFSVWVLLFYRRDFTNSYTRNIQQIKILSELTLEASDAFRWRENTISTISSYFPFFAFSSSFLSCFTDRWAGALVCWIWWCFSPPVSAAGGGALIIKIPSDDSEVCNEFMS